MTTCLGKSCCFGLPRVPFVNCCQCMYLVISLLVLLAEYGIWLYQFLFIAYLFTLTLSSSVLFSSRLLFIADLYSETCPHIFIQRLQSLILAWLCTLAFTSQEWNVVAALFMLLCLCFTALRHILGHFGRGQLTFPHCSWASLLGSLGSLPVLGTYSLASNWQLPFLNQRKEENGHRNDFMTKFHERMLPDVRIELATVRIPGGHGSDRAAAPGLLYLENQYSIATIRLCIHEQVWKQIYKINM